MDAWILNSICSYHMTPNKEWFTLYRSYSFSSVHLGYDKPCAITGIGTIKIQLHDRVVRTLYDVRHILYIRKNLIFLDTLHGNGFNYRSFDDRKILRVTKGVLTVMKGKQTMKNIYKLLGNIVVKGATVVESDHDNCTKLWHMRLGHLSEREMTKLHKRNLLKVLKVVN